MTRRELESKLQAAGLRIKATTLASWAQRDVIPRPFGPSRKMAQWPEWAFPESAGAAVMSRRGCGLREIASYRNTFRSLLEAGKDPTGPLFNKGILPPGEDGRRAFEWLCVVLKAHLGLPVEEPATIDVVPNADGTCGYKGSPALPSLAPMGALGYPLTDYIIVGN